MSRFALGAATMTVLVYLLIGCGPDAHHHPHRSPLPTAPSASPDPLPTSPAPRPGPPALVVLSDPGHVTYDRRLSPGECYASSMQAATDLPDPACTPGGIDPAVSQATIGSTICKPGYTHTIRPPLAETAPLKRKQYTAYGIPAGTTTELDHLVPLELGGDNAVSNLWPEYGPISGNPKDQVENDLNHAVCSGRIPLDRAQVAIAGDWVTAEHVLGLN